MKIKIGDRVKARLFGFNVVEANVRGIEVTPRGGKYGMPVKEAELDSQPGVLSLDNGNWCYFAQVIEKVEQ